MVPLPSFEDDTWELYGPDDWTQARNIAKENPKKLQELQRLFLIEADDAAGVPLAQLPRNEAGPGRDIEHELARLRIDGCDEGAAPAGILTE